MVRRLGDIGCEELAADTGFISLYLILPVFEKKRRKVMDTIPQTKSTLTNKVNNTKYLIPYPTSRSKTH